MKILLGMIALISTSVFAQVNTVTFVNTTYQTNEVKVTCYNQECNFLILTPSLGEEKLIRRSITRKAVEIGRHLEISKASNNPLPILGSTQEIFKQSQKNRREGYHGKEALNYAAIPLMAALELTVLLPFELIMTSTIQLERIHFSMEKQIYRASLSIEEGFKSDDKMIELNHKDFTKQTSALNDFAFFSTENDDLIMEYMLNLKATPCQIFKSHAQDLSFYIGSKFITSASTREETVLLANTLYNAISEGKCLDQQESKLN